MEHDNGEQRVAYAAGDREDAAGNSTTSASVTLTVSNSTPEYDGANGFPLRRLPVEPRFSGTVRRNGKWHRTT